MVTARIPVGVRAFTAGETDAHGNPIDGWADAVETLVYAVHPRVSSEPLPDRSEVVIGLTMLTPPDVTIGPRDRVVYRGEEYEVEGDIGNWNDGPFGWTPGLAVNLKRVEG